MDFDLTKVYHALNAEDVHVGSLVYGAQCAEGLKNDVREACSKFVFKVIDIQGDRASKRFKCLSTTGFQTYLEYVYMLFDVDSEFYDFAKAIYEGKLVWCHVDGKVTEQKSIVFNHPASCYTLGTIIPRMKEKHNGLYVFNYKGFDCELADCSGTDKYACFVDYWDDASGELNSDLFDWSFGSNCNLGNNYTVPEFIIKRLDDWIKKNSSKKGARRYE